LGTPSASTLRLAEDPTDFSSFVRDGVVHLPHSAGLGVQADEFTRAPPGGIQFPSWSTTVNSESVEATAAMSAGRAMRWVAVLRRELAGNLRIIRADRLEASARR
jgi:hypothetical protein